MRIRKTLSLASLAVVATTSTAMAHAGHAHEAGTLHVLSSPLHLALFLVMGVAFGALMQARRTPYALAASAALLASLFVQGTSHASEGGFVFGAQVVLTGAILAALTGRAITWLRTTPDTDSNTTEPISTAR